MRLAVRVQILLVAARCENLESAEGGRPDAFVATFLDKIMIISLY